jgi:hypothetical protein
LAAEVQGDTAPKSRCCAKLTGVSDTPYPNRLARVFLAVSPIDDDATRISVYAASTENPFASFPAATIVSTHNFGLSSKGASQNEQTCNSN